MSLLRDTMGNVAEMTILVKYSPKREKNAWKYPACGWRCRFTENNRFSKLSTTHWTVHPNSFHRIIDNYASLPQLYQSCMREPLATDIKLTVIWFPSQMISFFFRVQLVHNSYALSDNLAKLLQSKKLSGISGKRNVDLT